MLAKLSLQIELLPPLLLFELLLEFELLFPLPLLLLLELLELLELLLPLPLLLHLLKVKVFETGGTGGPGFENQHSVLVMKGLFHCEKFSPTYPFNIPSSKTPNPAPRETKQNTEIGKRAGLTLIENSLVRLHQDSTILRVPDRILRRRCGAAEVERFEIEADQGAAGEEVGDGGVEGCGALLVGLVLALVDKDGRCFGVFETWVGKLKLGNTGLTIRKTYETATCDPELGARACLLPDLSKEPMVAALAVKQRTNRQRRR